MPMNPIQLNVMLHLALFLLDSPSHSSYPVAFTASIGQDGDIKPFTALPPL
jgi:hypothetical protein